MYALVPLYLQSIAEHLPLLADPNGGVSWLID
jgi:hypothetical protein